MGPAEGVSESASVDGSANCVSKGKNRVGKLKDPANYSFTDGGDANYQTSGITRNVKQELMDDHLHNKETVSVNPDNPIVVDEDEDGHRETLGSAKEVTFRESCEEKEFDEESKDSRMRPLIDTNVTTRINFDPKTKPRRINKKKRRKQNKKGEKKQKKARIDPICGESDTDDTGTERTPTTNHNQEKETSRVTEQIARMADGASNYVRINK